MQAEIRKLTIRQGPPRRLNTVVVMAGGLGRRLGDLTRHLPKPLIPVAGQPVIERIIHRLKDQGFFNYVLTTHHLAEKIRDHCRDGSAWGIHIRYAHEATPLGTAGGLALIGSTGDDPILVCNADVLTDIDHVTLLSQHELTRADMTVVTMPHQVEIPFGVISTDHQGQVTSVTEKPVFAYRVSAGIYVINPELLSLIGPSERIDMPQVMDRAQLAGYRVCAYEHDGYWIDVGQPADLQRASEGLAEMTA
ncbi:sugar phosphate nucleotidyltransferase [Brevundimonas sp.]|uniref:nucleotidyltransferase family protein n=1 Tax=Brevundimonas sp. TaxID=1871086 RepID=UPI003BA8CA1B